MFFIIIIVLILYGWIEFETFVLMSEAVGGFWAFLGIFLTAFVGLSLLKSQSRAILADVQKNVGDPHTTIIAGLGSGVALILGAILMVVPGYATDAMGLVCFIPGLRTIIGLALLSRLKRLNLSADSNRFGFSAASFHHQPETQNRPAADAKNETIEGDFSEKK